MRTSEQVLEELREWMLAYARAEAARRRAVRELADAAPEIESAGGVVYAAEEGDEVVSYRVARGPTGGAAYAFGTRQYTECAACPATIFRGLTWKSSDVAVSSIGQVVHRLYEAEREASRLCGFPAVRVEQLTKELGEVLLAEADHQVLDEETPR